MVEKTTGHTVNADAPLMEAGVDSLGAVELGNLLQQATGDSVHLSSTFMFEFPTVRHIAHALQPRLADQLESDEDVPFDAYLEQLGFSRHLQAFEDEGCRPPPLLLSSASVPRSPVQTTYLTRFVLCVARYDDVAFLLSLDPAKLTSVLTSIMGVEEANALFHAMRCGASEQPLSIDIETPRPCFDMSVAREHSEIIDKEEQFESLMKRLGLNTYLKIFEDEGCAA
jgi:acyl carrier protein